MEEIYSIKTNHLEEKAEKKPNNYIFFVKKDIFRSSMAFLLHIN